MIDKSLVKLGKKAAKFDPRTLKLDKYLTEALPAPPLSQDWTKGIKDWGVMLNDNLSCCTIAAIGHAVQVFTLNTGKEVTVPDAVILDAYERWDGYDPSDPSTDQGGIELDVLKLWRKGTFAGHSLLAFADPKPANEIHIKQSIVLFGGVYIGVQLPISAQSQTLWDTVSVTNSDGEAGSWGGHAVFCPAYNSLGPVCITWGALQQMTWRFWAKYCDEAHALISNDWFSSSGVDPAGIDLKTLQADLNLVSA